MGVWPDSPPPPWIRHWPCERNIDVAEQLWVKSCSRPVPKVRRDSNTCCLCYRLSALIIVSYQFIYFLNLYSAILYHTRAAVFMTQNIEVTIMYFVLHLGWYIKWRSSRSCPEYTTRRFPAQKWRENSSFTAQHRWQLTYFSWWCWPSWFAASRKTYPFSGRLPCFPQERWVTGRERGWNNRPPQTRKGL